MSTSDPQSQKAVNEILSSIRQIITEEDPGSLPDEMKEPSLASSTSNLDKRDGSTDASILDLTRLVKEDGSVIQLTPKNDSEQRAVEVESGSSVFTSVYASPKNFSSVSESRSSPSFVSTTIDLSVLETSIPDIAVSSESASNAVTPSISTADSSDSSANPSYESSFMSFSSSPSTTPSPSPISSVPTDNLISSAALQESAAAFAELSRATQQSAKPLVDIPPTVETMGTYTVDGLMRELMRPLLKEWLDAHLPSLVRTLVVEQIEKVLQQRNNPPASS